MSYPCTDNTNYPPIKLTLERGRYLFELWGARSGIDYFYYTFALGAYVSGVLSIQKSLPIYIYLGGIGSDGSNQGNVCGGNNGGGTGGSYGSAGGGATDVRLDKSLQSRIIVAAGAGGGERVSTGHGGELEGLQGQYQKCTTDSYTLAEGSEPGTQDKGGKGGLETSSNKAESGSFGMGGSGVSSRDGGGGGGYFGGGGAPWVCSASGGSSYISGYPGCHSVINSSTTLTSSSSIHYSLISFTRTRMIAGNKNMPLPGNDFKTGIGNNGPGTIRITFLSLATRVCKTHKSYLFMLLTIIISQ